MREGKYTLDDVQLIHCEWRIYPVRKGERMADELPNIAPKTGFIVAPCLFRPEGAVMRNHAAMYIGHNPPIHSSLKKAQSYKLWLDKNRPWGF